MEMHEEIPYKKLCQQFFFFYVVYVICVPYLGYCPTTHISTLHYFLLLGDFFFFSRNKNNKNNKIMNSVLKWNTMLRKSLVEIHLTLLCFA